MIDEAENINDDGDDEYMPSTSAYLARVEQCHQVLRKRNLPKDLLLLDSCSTVNIISNRDMLSNIHKVKQPLRVQCNAGMTSTN